MILNAGCELLRKDQFFCVCLPRLTFRSRKPKHVTCGAFNEWVVCRRTPTHTQGFDMRIKSSVYVVIGFHVALLPVRVWPRHRSASWFPPTCARFLSASDFQSKNLPFILMTCYLRRLSAVITVTQQYWVTRPQTPASRSQPDPIRPPFPLHHAGASLIGCSDWCRMHAGARRRAAGGSPHCVCAPVMNQGDCAGRLKKLEKLLLWIMVRSVGGGVFLWRRR